MSTVSNQGHYKVCVSFVFDAEYVISYVFNQCCHIVIFILDDYISYAVQPSCLPLIEHL